MSIKKLPKSTKLVLLGIVVLIIVMGMIISREGKSVSPEPVEKSMPVILLPLNNITDNSVVSITSGEIESLEQVTLSSEMSGTIAQVNVSIGDKISAGQALVQFKAADKSAQLAQVQADYDNTLAAEASLLAQIETAKANHQKLILSTENRVATAEIAVEKSKNNLTQNAPQATENLISDAYDNAYIFLTSVQNSLTKKFQDADSILGIENTYINNKFKYLLGAKNSHTLNTANESYHLAIKEKLKFDTTMSNLSISSNDSQIDAAIVLADSALLETKTLFLDLTSLLDSTIVSSDFSQNELNSLINMVNTSRDDISNKRTMLINIKQSLQDAKNTLDNRELTNLKNKVDLEITYRKSLSDLEDIKKQVAADIYASEAGIKQLEVNLGSQDAMIKRSLASISGVQAEFAKTSVRSPISGTVASIDVKMGELVSTGKIVAKIINTDGLQVKAFVPDSVLASLKIGGTVLVDGSPIGTILRIAPSVNEITKKVELIISVEPKDGLTFLVGQFVELKILASADNLVDAPILLPLQAIKVDPTSHSIFVVNDQNIVEEIQVETGKLVGDKIEIISDLSIYDAVISTARGIVAGQAVTVIQE
ncbi:MAG: efflux RND transporter periplasmic adaptor subunit [Patescibacteria group bacterium]|nr:efflux RND transporter periplasmic adaptor subunit [Patescibacteria group bacterium]